MEIISIATLLVAFFILGECQVHFSCPQLPPLTSPAKTVHELRPQDIKVVMTLGDSITAGKPELADTVEINQPVEEDETLISDPFLSQDTE